MPRGQRRGDEDDDLEDEEVELDEDDDEEEMEDSGKRGGKKRRRNEFIDDAAVEDEEEDEDDYEDEEDDDEEYGRDRGGRKAKQRKASNFFDIEAKVDSDEDDDEEEEGEDDFINDAGAEIADDGVDRRSRHSGMYMPYDNDVDEDALRRHFAARYGRNNDMEYGEEATDVEQQALLPSIKDPKLWMVKCILGHERESAICLMQKSIDRPELQIKSVVALDHLKGYIYIEAEKEAHVKEAFNGLRIINQWSRPMLVPLKEMTDVLSVESKHVDLSRDTWVRMKRGIYKGDLAKVVDVDNVKQKVTVKLIPRIDLQMIANKMEGRDAGKKRTFVPPPRLFNIDEAREMHIRVERRKDRETGEHFESIDNMMFKDGFLYKTVAFQSISKQNIQPTIDELDKFQKPEDEHNSDVASLSNLFTNRKKGHFLKGDAVVVVRGDLKNLMGWVEKVEDENVFIRPKMSGLPNTLAFNHKDLCKYFKEGDHVKVVSGVQEGATGMVVKVEGHVVTILSDTTKEDIRVFADNVVESSEVTAGVTRIGEYELHDLVQLDNTTFGVIIRVESEAFQVLKGVPDRPEVVLVRLREIKSKIDRKTNAQDRCRNKVSMKDIVRVCEGPCKGKQGPVEHIHKGILFIHDRHHLEHAGFICVKAQSCLVVGGLHEKNGVDSLNRFSALRSSTDMLKSPRKFHCGRPPIDSGGRYQNGSRGAHDALVGRFIRIRTGPFKGYRGRVKEITGSQVRVELDSQMKIVAVNKGDIADAVGSATPAREMPRYGSGSETPLHPSRTPLHPYQTPIRDPGATPIHDGMRTPMRDRAWAPMSPPRDWEDGNPASWGSSPRHQSGTPTSRPYEAPTPGSGWANTPGGNYSDSGTPKDSGSPYANIASPYVPSTPGQPMTPNSMPYLPGTPGGQPTTPGNVGLDIMSPALGGEDEGCLFMPEIVVSVGRGIAGDDPLTGVVREVLLDGTCKVAMDGGDGAITTVPNSELKVVTPKKSEKVKILSGSLRACTGKLIGIDGVDGIVKLDKSFEVKILDIGALAKLATQ